MKTKDIVPGGKYVLADIRRLSRVAVLRVAKGGEVYIRNLDTGQYKTLPSGYGLMQRLDVPIKG